MRRVRDSEGQTILKLDGSLPPRAGGPPLHIHFHSREEGIVKQGSLGVQVGKQKSVVQTGGSVVLPAGVVHNWWNAGDDILVFSGPGNSSGRPGPLPASAVCGAQREPIQ